MKIKDLTIVLAMLCLPIIATVAILVLEPFSDSTTEDTLIHPLQEDATLTVDDTIIRLAIADTDEERQKGLMFAKELSKNEGMLFIFEDEAIQTFWMKNTLISLDIIYLDKELRVVKIHPNAAVNQTEVLYPSEEPAMYVIELVAGRADELSIGVDDTLDLKITD